MSTKVKSKFGAERRQQLPAKSPPLPGVPERIANFIGIRPIVKGEDAAKYDALFEQLVELIAPEEVMEWIWLKDLADAIWEAQRARRLRDQILDLGRFRAMRLVAENLLQNKRVEAGFKELVSNTVASWTGPEGETKMAAFLAGYGLDPSAIAAEVFMNRSQVYDQLDRIAVAADKRRDAIFREIERYRAWRAAKFEEAAKVVNGESEEVTAKRPGLLVADAKSQEATAIDAEAEKVAAEKPGVPAVKQSS